MCVFTRARSYVCWFVRSGWVVGIAARDFHAANRPSDVDGANRNPPGSAISLVREITYDPASRMLRSNPMPELEQLRNGSLFQVSSLLLQPGGALKTIPLPAGSGGTIDLTVSFVLGTQGDTRAGVSVLANDGNISESTVIRLEVGLPGSDGTRHGTASGRVELAPGDCPWSNFWECQHPECILNRTASKQCPSFQRNRAARPPDLLWNASFTLRDSFAANSSNGTVDMRVLVDRSIVEVQPSLHSE